MLKDAISKLKAEMSQGTNKTYTYIQVVGRFLLQHLEANPESAGKILAADKTIGKSLDEMRKVAEENKVGTCAVLTDAEGFAVVLKYFEIESPISGPVSVTPVPAAVPAAPTVDFDVRLEDLL
jgi:hypothetical protein